ncbi:MAG: hypothetical protein QNJ13_01845 [Paracoccaceae bacterium]|nr:hypothetical protein [Paracoccaceae bacterium]
MSRRPARPRPIYAIDPVAFLIALPGTLALFAAPAGLAAGLEPFGIDDFGPLLVLAVLGGGGVAMGGPIFLTVGGLRLFFLLRRGVDDSGAIAGQAFVTNLLLTPLAAALAALTGHGQMAGIVLFYGLMGCAFAPLWGLVFAKLYRRLRRDFYAIPVT